MIFLLLLSVTCTAQAAAPVELQINFTRTNGVIRPLHGVNLGPLCYRGIVDVSRYHRELAVPLTRLHDVVWLGAEAVDIHTIFPEFRNDPAAAGNFHFGPTDDYIQSIIDVGSQITYRLGESIEHTPRKHWVRPPPDPGKWAEICLGIIRHYNQGWADGFHHRIRYWEIWNEPDVRPMMWTGTDREYFQLYEAAAKAIKHRFPDVQVGGPALGNTGTRIGTELKPSAFLQRFLEYCKAHQLPLDFFSWHCYASDPWELFYRARAVRKLLDQFGYGNAEIHLDEWNYLPASDWTPLSPQASPAIRREWWEKMGSPDSAAFAAAALILFQDAPLTAANYYTGDNQLFGLFDFFGAPRKPFYAFKAFRILLDTPIRCRTGGGLGGRLALAAGINAVQTEAAVLISNFDNPAESFRLSWDDLPWKGDSTCEQFSVDATADLRRSSTTTLRAGSRTLDFELRRPGVALLKFRPEH